MRRAPDMQATTRNRPLAINTSFADAFVEPLETPLGTRWELRTRTVRGQRTVIALMRDRDSAVEACALLNDAGESLRAAARLIADDGRGTT